MNAGPGVAPASPGITRTPRVRGRSPACIACAAGKHESCAERERKSVLVASPCRPNGAALRTLLSLVFCVVGFCWVVFFFFFIELFDVII